MVKPVTGSPAQWRGARCGWGGLVLGLLVVGCVPTRWPAQPPPAPRPIPAPVPVPIPIPIPIPTPTPAPATLPGTGTGTGTGGGNPPFYEVLGQRYFVAPSSNGYRAEGTASWYGAPFHGRRTSSGAVYNMHELTAAHKTLPLPSLVRVTNLDNGKSAVVTVNDRGPFVKNRLIDLSYAGAQALDIVRTGTGRVVVEALTLTLANPARLFLQVGAFSTQANALQRQLSLKDNGVDEVFIRYDDQGVPPLYRVRIGPLAGAEAYDALAARMEALGILDTRLVTESPNP